MSVTDGRRAPFCYQTIGALVLLRATFEGERRATALAIYCAMTEVANELRHNGGREGFEAPRKRIAEYAGVGVRTLDKYAAEFAKAGLLKIKRRSVNGLNLPNLWVLCEPKTATGTQGAGSAGVAQPEALAQPNAVAQPETLPTVVALAQTDAVARSMRGGSAARDTPVKEDLQEDHPPDPPQAGGENTTLVAPRKKPGNGKRIAERHKTEMAAWAARHFPGADPAAVGSVVGQLTPDWGEPTPSVVRAYAEQRGGPWPALLQPINERASA